MTDYCIICECEPIEPDGWFKSLTEPEYICPWCIKDARKAYLKKNPPGTI